MGVMEVVAVGWVGLGVGKGMVGWVERGMEGLAMVGRVVAVVGEVMEVMVGLGASGLGVGLVALGVVESMQALAGCCCWRCRSRC